MRRAFFAILTLSLAAFPVAAQEIRVLGGEHRGFTRFVFYLPAGIEAVLTRQDHRLRLTTSAPVSGFDVSAAFDRIPRHRVSAIVADGKSATLSLACDCDVVSQRAAGGLFILDITDADRSEGGARLSFATGIEPAAARFGRSVPGRQAGLTWDHLAKANMAGSPTAPPEMIAPPAADAATPNPTAETLDPVTLPATLPDRTAAESEARQTRLMEAEQQLIEQLAKAASQGLLEVAPPTTQAEPAEPGQMPGSDQASTTAAPPVQAARGFGPSVTAETTIDRDYRAALGTRAVTSDGEICFDDDLLDLNDWGGPGAFGQELGRRRMALYGERDIRNDAVMLDLARFYIRYGFGAEAEQVLQQAKSSQVEWRVLLSMARIVERGHERPAGAFSGQIDCDTAAAFWAAMTHETIPDGFPPNIPAILRSLSRLPPDLREMLGPILANRFISAGDQDTANRILRLTERGVQATGPEHDLTTARLERSRGQDQDAVETLAAVVAKNGPVAPEALIELIDLQLASTDPVSADLVALAQAYAIELRGQPLAQAMERAAVLGMASIGDYVAALHRFLTWPEAMEAMRDETRSRLAVMMAGGAGDLELIGLAARLARELPDRLTPEAGNLVAARLTNLGFGDLALTLISGPASGAENQERRLIRARIALAQARPRRAEAELLGLDSPEAKILRIAAKALRGDHRAASLGFAEMNEPERALHEAWLDGDWARVAEIGTDIRAEAARMIEPGWRPSPPDPGPDAARNGPAPGLVSRSRSLISDTNAARDIIDRLLTELTVSGGGES